MKPTPYIWMNGQLVEWERATVHVLSHVIHYGSSVFEGIRCYDTPKGSAVFRLSPHVRRLFDSAKIYRMPIPYDADQLSRAVKETIRANGLKSAYVRPAAFRGYGSLGVDPRSCPVDVIIATIEWGRYLGEEALENGVDVCVSSWNRPAPNTHPSLSKAGGNYLNSQLVKLEAIQNGYSEGIVLGTDGYISEGSGENLFVIKDGAVYTAPVGNSLLPGITRASVLTLFDQLGVEVRQQPIPREMLYIADELFFTGTAAEITPIRSVDGISVGEGRRGPLTAQVQHRFFGIINGEIPDDEGWLEYL